MPAPKPIEVTITLCIERAGWHDSPFGRLYGDYEREHELRAEVSFGSPNDKPEVSWLDKAVLEDLDLFDSELQGAEEQAAEAGYLKLRGELTELDRAEERADREYDERRDEEVFGRAG